MAAPRTVGVLLLSAAMAMPVVAPPAAVAHLAHTHVDYHEWRSFGEFRQGRFEGTSRARGGPGVVIAQPVGQVEHVEPGLGTTNSYDFARWISPHHPVGFHATQVIASWNAITPGGTWLQVDMRGRTATGVDTGWYVMGRWASGDSDIQRATVSGQSDEYGFVDVDTFQAAQGRALRGVQLRVTLYRLAGTATTPTLLMAGAMASAVPDRFTVPASSPGPARGIELPVPRYSQNVHVGEYPQYDGGGEAWCSPTSTEMVVEYWGRGPTREDLSWVDPRYADPSVDHAARFTYDYDYHGTGNWPFNTAYAATFGLRGRVTRLRSLPELERYVARGIPVITSQSFRADELDGAGYGTAGHIMVVIGFTAAGDVIANDPAASSNQAVRRVYPRAQFENIWLRTKRYQADGSVASGSGGIVYLIAPDTWRLTDN